MSIAGRSTLPKLTSREANEEGVYGFNMCCPGGLSWIRMLSPWITWGLLGEGSFYELPKICINEIAKPRSPQGCPSPQYIRHSWSSSLNSWMVETSAFFKRCWNLPMEAVTSAGLAQRSLRRHDKGGSANAPKQGGEPTWRWTRKLWMTQYVDGRLLVTLKWMLAGAGPNCSKSERMAKHNERGSVHQETLSSPWNCSLSNLPCTIDLPDKPTQIT